MKHLLLTTIAAVLLVATTAFAEPIHDAAKNGDLAGVQAELDKGVDVNSKNVYGETPLHWTAWEGHKEVAELLITKGADVNAKDEDGFTPLHFAAYYAARYGHKEIVELLIAAGADVNAKDEAGNTPLDMAITSITISLILAKNLSSLFPKGHPETADLLRKHGGKTGEELALMPRLVQHGRFAFSFDAKEGKVYEVQDSFDLLNWEVIKTYTGTGSSVRFDEERDHDPPQWFYRVRVVE
jgi:ankyrin repeat protein